MVWLYLLSEDCVSIDGTSDISTLYPSCILPYKSIQFLKQWKHRWPVIWVAQGDPWQVKRVDGENKHASTGAGQWTFPFCALKFWEFPTFDFEDQFSRLIGFLTSGAPSAASTWSSHKRSLLPLGTLTDTRCPCQRNASREVSRWLTARWWGQSRSSSPSAQTASHNSALTTLCSLT